MFQEGAGAIIRGERFDISLVLTRLYDNNISNPLTNSTNTLGHEKLSEYMSTTTALPRLISLLLFH